MIPKIYKNKWVHDVPDGARNVASILLLNGYKCYLIGGCVRNSILNIPVKDWDICTNAKPNEIEKLFENSKHIGESFGVMLVTVKNEKYEVATFRNDGKYSDGRRPDSVSLCDSLEEDCSRRDFTINQLAYDFQSDTIIDYNDGMKDIRRKTIKCIGKPEERFSEDFLRMLRAVRFAAQLRFKIDRKTTKEIVKLSKNLSYIASEKVQEEFNKILLSNPLELEYMYENGMMNYVIPDLDILYSKETLKNIINTMVIYYNTTENVELSCLLAILLKNLSNKKDFDEKNWLKNVIRYPNEVSKEVLSIVYGISHFITKQHNMADNGRYLVKYMLSIYGVNTFKRILNTERCFAMSDKNKHRAEDKVSELSKIVKVLNSVVENNEPFLLKDLKINGNDLLELGVTGEKVGKILHSCLDCVMSNPELNRRESLLDISKKLI